MEQAPGGDRLGLEQERVEVLDLRVEEGQRQELAEADPQPAAFADPLEQGSRGVLRR